MLKLVRAPSAYVKARAYPKQVTQECDAERYDGLKFTMDETMFAAYDKANFRKAKVLVIASSDFVNTSMSLFGPDAIILEGIDLDWMQWHLVFNGKQR